MINKYRKIKKIFQEINPAKVTTEEIIKAYEQFKKDTGGKYNPSVETFLTNSIIEKDMANDNLTLEEKYALYEELVKEILELLTNSQEEEEEDRDTFYAWEFLYNEYPD